MYSNCYGMYSVALLAGIVPAAASAQSFDQNAILFRASDLPNRPFFRAPELIVAADGSLLVFAEAREQIHDPGQGPGVSDIVMKRSTDGGTTWSTIRVLQAGIDHDYTQPSVVLNQASGDLHLHFSQVPDLFISNGTFVSTGYGENTFHSYVMSSSDHGETWSLAERITQQVKDSAWRAMVLGPTTGVQLRWQTDSARNGRLVIPSFYSDGLTAGNFIVYNDHGGETAQWKRAPITTGAVTNEVDLVELTNGHLLMSARSDVPTASERYQFISTDGGQTWGAPQAVDLPIIPIDISLIRYSAQRDGHDRDRLLLSAPLGDPAGQSSNGNLNDRYNIGIWTSYDEGKTYINPRQVSSGWGGYSALQRLPDGRIGLVYESTFSFTEQQMRYARFDLAWVEGQTHDAAVTHYDGFGNTIDRLRGGMGWSGSWNGTATPVGTTGLSFSGAPLPGEGGRLDLVNGQSVTRQLATPIDMNQNQSTYLSVLISQQYDTSPNAGNEFLTFSFRDSADNSLAAFGVGSGEEFIVGHLGNGGGTAQGTLQRSATYMLLVKLVTQDASPGNYDQIFLKVYRSGVDAIDTLESSIDWTAIGGTQLNRSNIIDRLAILTGLEVHWSIDELRIGSTFSSVTGMLTPVPEPGVFSLVIASVPVLLRRKRRLLSA